MSTIISFTAFLLRRKTSSKLFILLLLFTTGCSISSPLIKITARPTENEAISITSTAQPAVIALPSTTITPTQQEPTQAPTITLTSIPPSETPSPFPTLDFHTELSTLPRGQYLVYWSFADPYCGIKAVSITKEVYEIINFGCSSSGGTYSLYFQQNLELSGNALYMLLPQGDTLYLYHLIDHQQERLAPSQRKDCVITSVSWDGKKFAGRCGNPETGGYLAIRTIDRDWIEIKPFTSENENQIAYATAWSPDGKKLAFESTGVFVLNDVDQCLEALPDCSVLITGPYWKKPTNYITWSSDGKQLALTLSNGIMIYDIKTKQLKTVINYGTLDLWMHGAAFSPDGKWIGYSRDQDPSMKTTDSNAYITSLNDDETFFLTGKDVHQVIAWLNIEP